MEKSNGWVGDREGSGKRVMERDGSVGEVRGVVGGRGVGVGKRVVGGRGKVVVHKPLLTSYMIGPCLSLNSKTQRISNTKLHHDWLPRLPQSSHFKYINACHFQTRCIPD